MSAAIGQSAEVSGTLSGDNVEANGAFIDSLVLALKTRDADTYSHSERTVGLCLVLGRECALAPEEMKTLALAARLHDIGKLGVPDAILRKPASLDEREWAIMRRHPREGSDIICGLAFLADAARAVLQHHENWDGSGYPAGLRGEEIDLNARVLSVADAFDAMVSDRAYRRARSFEEASAELCRCAGTQFDPRVVDAFQRVPQGRWEGACAGR